MPIPETGGTATRRLLEDQITDERERRSSFESRGVGVITAGGVIASFVVGIGAAFADPTKILAPTAAVLLTILALIALIAAAILAIAVVLPTEYEGVDPGAFLRLIDERFWDGPYGPVDRRIAEAQLMILISARQANRDKAILLSWALGVEAAAVVLLGTAVLVVLLSR